MADEWIKVGSSFTVTCDTRDPVTNLPLITLTDYTGHLVYYRRPGGKWGTLSPDSVTATAMVATVPASLNPLTGSGRWPDGYAGNWEFYPYCQGSGSIEFHGKSDIVVVRSQWRTKQ